MIRFLKMNLKNKRLRSGFTLVETLVAILLMGLASSSFLIGITQAKLNLQSTRIKDIAHQELKVYTENIKSLVAGGVESFGTDHPGGIQITLIADPKTGDPIIEGNLHKTVRRASKPDIDYAIYYYIHTWITWPENKKIFGQKTENSEADFEKIEFKNYQVKFSL